MVTTRQEVHRRQIECRGFRRSDGLWDVEGRLIDTKGYAFPHGDRGIIPTGEPVHDMGLVLTFDTDLLIRNATATMSSSPYAVCSGATHAMSQLIGLHIRAGWLSDVRKRLPTDQRCTHLFEMLGPLATTAFQTLSAVRGKPSDNPGKIDSCYAYSSDRALVRRIWPDRYTGEP